jgi:hypothetical protein
MKYQLKQYDAFKYKDWLDNGQCNITYMALDLQATFMGNSL